MDFFTHTDILSYNAWQKKLDMLVMYLVLKYLLGIPLSTLKSFVETFRSDRKDINLKEWNYCYK